MQKQGDWLEAPLAPFQRQQPRATPAIHHCTAPGLASVFSGKSDGKAACGQRPAPFKALEIQVFPGERAGNIHEPDLGTSFFGEPFSEDSERPRAAPAPLHAPVLPEPPLRSAPQNAPLG